MDLTELLKTQMAFEVFTNDFKAFNPQEFVGSYFQNYKITNILGQGGMAIVFCAERSDGAYQRKVAIKIINPDLSNEEYQTRFSQEWNLLAELTHPNIAQMYDAGLTEEGIPYMIIEYIDGLSLDDYLISTKLDFGEQLQLFTKICSAVSYAHENLIIHRDIKPANIIVTNKGEPKLLDFGIGGYSRQSDDKDPSHTPYTYRFATPEQIENKRTTFRTDIFQLGYIFHLILTGRNVFESEDKTEIKRALTGRTDETGTITQLNIHNNQHTSKFGKFSEARSIISKSMQLSPIDRYQGVAEITADIDAIKNKTPLSTYQNNKIYDFSKFIRRHISMVVLSVIFVSIIIFTTLSYLNNIVSTNQKLTSELDANKDLVRFLESIFETRSTRSKDYKKLDVVTLVSKATKKLLENKELSTRNKITISISLGDIFFSLGQYEKVIELLQPLLSMDKLPRESLISINLLLTRTYKGTDKGNPEKLAKDTLKLIQQSAKPSLFAEQKMMFSLLLSNMSLIKRDFENAIALAEQALEIYEKNESKKSGIIGDIYNAIAQPKFYSDRASAIPDLIRVKHEFSKTYGADGRALIDVSKQLAISYDANGQPEESLNQFNQALRISQIYKSDAPRSVMGVHNSLGVYYQNQQKPELAIEHLEKSISIVNEYYPDDKRMLLVIKNNIANTYNSEKNIEKKRALYLEIITIYESNPTPDLFYPASLAYFNLGDDYMSTKEYNKSITYLKKSLVIDIASYGENSVDTGWTKLVLSQAECYAGNITEGKSLIQSVTNTWNKSVAKNSDNMTRYYRSQYTCIENKENNERVITLLNKIRTNQFRNYGIHSKYVDVSIELANALTHADNTEEAHEILTEILSHDGFVKLAVYDKARLFRSLLLLPKKRSNDNLVYLDKLKILSKQASKEKDLVYIKNTIDRVGSE